MRDRAWCGEHDRSLEFATTDQERVCFSGLGNAETTCRIETAPENDGRAWVLDMRLVCCAARDSLTKHSVSSDAYQAITGALNRLGNPDAVPRGEEPA